MNSPGLSISIATQGQLVCVEALGDQPWRQERVASGPGNWVSIPGRRQSIW